MCVNLVIYKDSTYDNNHNIKWFHVSRSTVLSYILLVFFETL